MSGGISATAIAGLVAAAASAGTAIYSADQQRSQANKARDASTQATADAAAAAKVAPGTQAAKAASTGVGDQIAQNESASGSSASTLLTGPGGIDPNNLQLGRNNLGGSQVGNTLLGSNSLLGA